jgi:hypothetical protein
MNDSSIGSDRWTPWISFGVTVAAVTAIAAHLVWPHLKIDYVTVILLAIACLPWLRGIISSVDLPGGTSIKLAARQRVVVRDQQETIDAVRVVATAGRTVPSDEKLARIYKYAAEYEQIRLAMPSGRPRTKAMGQVARRMLSLMPLDSYSPITDLLSHKAGRRLVAYLSLVAEPRLEDAEELTNTLTEREGIPYNQGWALRALSRVVDIFGVDSISSRGVAQLKGMRDGLRYGSDRQLLLADLVDRIS